ncbi:hypothetical protein VitviT2T_023983 [Vitis vinifera]|uniref:Hydrophobic protein OSR8 n=3 Tax=Vitis vinifera TaxID=29760 RepID=A0ABY9DGD2_VITVI
MGSESLSGFKLTSYIGFIFVIPLVQLLNGDMMMQAEFWICLVLTFFGYLPGIVYAVYVITK